MRILFENLTNYDFYVMFLDLINRAIKHEDRKISLSEAEMLGYFMDLPEK